MSLYKFDKSYALFEEAARRGIFLHPHHNWFVSAALTGPDIDRTAEVARECFALTRQHFHP